MVCTSTKCACGRPIVIHVIMGVARRSTSVDPSWTLAVIRLSFGTPGMTAQHEVIGPEHG